MIRRRDLFLVLFFACGWVVHLLVSYIWTVPMPAPQELLLAVLALGALGRTDAAQTLGFFWGLMLDVQGVTLFGCQGWILAAAGYGAGNFSRQIDAEKLWVQALMAAGGTLFYLAVLAQVELLFRRGGAVHVPAPGMAFVQLLVNAAVAPAVFKGVWLLERRFLSGEGGHVFRS